MVTLRAPRLRELAGLVAANGGEKVERPRKSKYRPVLSADGPLIYGADGHWWVYFTLPVISSYENKSMLDKEAIQACLSQLFGQLEGHHFHLLSLPYNINIDMLTDNPDPKNPGWLQQSLLAEDDQEGRAAYAQFVAANAAFLKGRSFKARVLRLGIRLDTDFPGSRRDAPENLDITYGIKAAEHTRLIPKITELLGKIRTAGFANAAPVRGFHMLDLVQRTIWQGCPDRPPIPPESSTRAYGSGELESLGNANVTEKPQYLTIEHFDQTTFVSMVALASLPGVPYLGYLWLVDENGDPVSTSIRGQVVPAGVILSETTKSIADARGHQQFLEARNGQDGQEEINNSVVAIRDKLEYARAGQPIVRFTATAILTSSRLDELRERQRDLLQRCLGLGVVWVAPSRQQLRLYNAVIPGSRYSLDWYKHDATTDTAGAMMLHVTGLSRHTAPYIGELTGIERGPFSFSPKMVLNPEADTATGMLLMGPPGSGKTFAGLFLAILMAYMGATVLVREGTKGDIAKQFKAPPGLRVHNVDFSTFPGGLNPGLLGSSDTENASIMAEWLLECCSSFNAKWRGPLYAACLKVIKANPDAPDFREVIWALQADDGVRKEIGDDLAEIADLDQADACYGSRENADELIARLGPGLSLWSAQSWIFPHASKPEDKWRPVERFSAACLGLMFHVSRRISQDRNTVTATFDDELHEMGATVVFRELDRIGRQGRSLQSLAAYATHDWDDLPKGFMNYITTVFVFRQGDKKAAKQAAEALGLDPEDPNVLRMIMTLGCDKQGNPHPALKGEFLVRLYDGSVLRARLTEELGIGVGNFITNFLAYQAQNRLKTPEGGR